MLKAKTAVFRCAALLLAPAALCAGDAPLLALRPLYTPETAVLKPALVGLWTSLFTVRIEPDGAAGYIVVDPADGQEYARFHLVPIGGETIADVVFGESQLAGFQLPVHCFARVRLEGSTLHVDWLGSEKLAQRVDLTGWPKHERLRAEGQDDDSLVLTASSTELRQFVLECLKGTEAFGETDDFERANPPDKGPGEK